MKQEELGFVTSWTDVRPTIKLYSLSCNLNKFFSNPHRQLDLVYVMIVVVVLWFGMRWFNRKRKIDKMYNYLREKVIAAPEETLNVTHTMVDLESEFGRIDEDTWKKINEVRTGRKEIGFYEDDFLYWKKM